MSRKHQANSAYELETCEGAALACVFQWFNRIILDGGIIL